MASEAWFALGMTANEGLLAMTIANAGLKK